MQDIAARAGLAVGTLYNYFPSKPELVLALVREDTRAGAAAAEARSKEEPGDPVAHVAAVVDAVLAPFARHPRELWRELLRAALGDPELGAGFLAEDLRLVGVITRCLEDLRARGALAESREPGRAAVALYGVFLSWFFVFVTRPEFDFDALRREVRAGIALVMEGLLP